MLKIDQARDTRNDARFAIAATSHILCSTIVCKLTDLGGTCSLMLDKHAGVAKFVPAYDALSTLPNWDNLRLLDSEGLEEHLLDSLHRRRQHYKGFLSQQRFLTLK